VYRNPANADSLLAKTQLCIEMAISDAVIRDSVRVVFPAACGDLSMNFFDGKTFLESVGSGVKVQLIGYQIVARFNTGYPVLLSQNSPYEMQIDGVSYSDVMASMEPPPLDDLLEEVELEEEEIVELWRVEKQPTVTKQVTPEYPDAARRANITGKVFVTALIDKEGRVEQIGKITGPEVFREAAKAAALKWRFKPGFYKNKPVKVWVSLPFTFQLK
jgi:TonB family protein